MSADEHNYNFESASSGASLTFPMQSSALQKNGYVVIKGRPCKIVDITTAKGDRYGQSMVHLVGLDIFTGKRLEDTVSSTHNMEVPNINRGEFPLISIEDDFLSLMNGDGSTKANVRVPEGALGRQIKANSDDGKDLLISVMEAMGEAVASSYKEVK
ncbi:Eukaryotic translation initiation factor 5A [Linnemannia gamsii]|uniref:Eukaryotic translation initiation factor 5A n=1 Tax=Linnemannia gamsii TaxID=64522 RepID=A0ABQ7JVW2_9FUNG|nr:Eukaryotic translation initiation factor 5A [Linnemannia gamsii]